MPRSKFPKKLVAGDEVRVVSFAESLYGFDKTSFSESQKYLASHGLELGLGKHARKRKLTVSQKIEDFHDALSDQRVRMIIAAGGGFNSNELLDEIDYSLVAGTAKIIQGYSDITAVLNAIHVKTGLVTYYGPNFGGLGNQEGSEYTQKYLDSNLFDKRAFDLKENESKWYDKDYSRAVAKVKTYNSSGWWQLNKGIGLGRVVAGHIGTLLLLQGTEFAPKLKGAVLCIEADLDYRPEHFRRELVALTQQKNFKKLEGLLLGRFPSSCGVERKWLQDLVDDLPILNGVPVIANVDFGHTSPKVTLPIGGEIAVRSQHKLAIRVTEH